MGIFLKAKVPRLAENYPYELVYAVTHPDFRRMGISRELIRQLLDSKPDVKFYATTKNDDIRDLLAKSGFIRTGNSYQNSAGETLDLFTFR